MTILNVNASAARVLVCMDSEVVALDRLRRAEQGKLMYLSNTNVVIGVRGIQVFAFALHWAAWNMPDASWSARSPVRYQRLPSIQRKRSAVCSGAPR